MEIHNNNNNKNTERNKRTTKKYKTPTYAEYRGQSKTAEVLHEEEHDEDGQVPGPYDPAHPPSQQKEEAQEKPVHEAEDVQSCDHHYDDAQQGDLKKFKVHKPVSVGNAEVGKGRIVELTSLPNL